jgi:hypothetical protein
MITRKHDHRSTTASRCRLSLTATLALLLLSSTACSGEDAPRPEEPPATSPYFTGSVSPATAYWGTQDARFVISGGVNLLGKSFSAKLGTPYCARPDCLATGCASATVDPADPSKLEIVCDIPAGAQTTALAVYVLYDGLQLTGYDAEQYIQLEWPPATGPASFSAASASALIWGKRKAPLRVSGGVNLPGHVFTAALDGIPCSSVAVSSADPTRLELSCSTRPGGTRGTASLAIQEGGVTIPGGEVVVDVEPCRDPGPAADGVPLPLLCNAPPGSIAAASAGLEGIWRGPWHGSFALFAPDGRFMSTGEYLGGQWTTTTGSTWTPVSAEHWRPNGDVVPLTTEGTFVPFTRVSYTGGGYGPANALLVSQAGDPGTVRVAGTWGTSEAPLTLTVDATGAFTGTTNDSDRGRCSLAGTITVTEPPKNMLSVSMVATGGTDCKLWQSGPLTGLGYVDAKVLAPTWPSSPYEMEYTLWFVVRSEGQYYVFAGATR